MDFTQRSTIPVEAEVSGRLWSAAYSDPGDAGDEADRPAGEPDIPDPLPSDHYVTIDERVGGVVGVVAAPWPTVDPAGLQFGDDIEAAWFDIPELQATVDRMRSAGGAQLERPLRIGDTFWVRGYDAESSESWTDLRDVTAEARGMAKAAVAVVAVGVVDEQPYLASAQADAAGDAAGDAGEAAPDGFANQSPPPGPQTASPVI
jgi:hypothetical protein